MTHSPTTLATPRPRPAVECWGAKGGEAGAFALGAGDLDRCEREVQHLRVRETATAAARQAASALNAEASAAMGELLAPARALLERGGALPAAVGRCIERKVAEIAFWRRVLWGAYPDDFASPRPPPDFLVRYLLEC